MPRLTRRVLLQAVATTASLCVVLVTVWALGGGPFDGLDGQVPDWFLGGEEAAAEYGVQLVLPEWLTITLALLAVGHAVLAGVVAGRGLPRGVPSVLTLSGVTTVGAGYLIAALSVRVPDPLVAVPVLGGVSIACIGLWTLDGVALRAWLSTHLRPTVGVAIVIVAVGLYAGIWAPLAGLSLVLLTAGVGDALLPVVTVAAGRLLLSDGGWSLERHNTLRILSVWVATVGLVAVLQVPATRLPVNQIGLACAETRWAEFAYTVEWSSLVVEYSDGCGIERWQLDRRWLLGGSALFVAGVLSYAFADRRARRPAQR